MNCSTNTLSGLNTRCKETSFGGIKEVYIAFYDEVTTTINPLTNTIVPQMPLGCHFYQYILMKNSAILTSTYDSATNLFTNEVTIEFEKMDTPKRIELNILVHSPIAVIVLDSNNRYWYLGKDDSVECSTATLTTGQVSGDRNYMAITFTSYSIESPYEVLKSDVDNVIVGHNSITYNINGGEGTPLIDSASPYVEGATATVLAPSSDWVKWDGEDKYEFDYWNTEADGSGEDFYDGDEIVMDENITLYAQWTEWPKCTLTYDGNGGTGYLVDDRSPYYLGDTITVIPNDYHVGGILRHAFVKSGYTFTTWNTKADGTGIDYDGGDTFAITANTTLYAQWEEVEMFTVTYDAQMGGATITDSGSPYASGSTVAVLNNPFTKPGYSFEGWMALIGGASSGPIYDGGETFTIVGNTELVAQWVENPSGETYTVTYNANGGTGTLVDSNSPYASGSTVYPLPNTFTKEGQFFVTWNTKADGSGDEYDDSGSDNFVISANTTLYAQWATPLKATSQEDNSVIGISSIHTGQTLEYSTDGRSWTGMNTSSVITLNSGNTVYLRGTQTAQQATYNHTKFGITGKIALSGPITALLDYANQSKFETRTPINKFACCGLFEGCTGLVEAPSLPGRWANQYCYFAMFHNCTNLKTAPTLDTGTQVLSYACGHMYEGCTSLVNVQASLPGNIQVGSYEHMFENCSSLTTAPELPAPSLYGQCYAGMFAGCTSLTAAPELPATTLAQKCYASMFSGCTSLSGITCLATNISATDCTNYWVDGVSANGTFTKNASMSGWTTGTNGIPSGWTVQDYSA